MDELLFKSHSYGDEKKTKKKSPCFTSPTETFFPFSGRIFLICQNFVKSAVFDQNVKILPENLIDPVLQLFVYCRGFDHAWKDA